MKKRAKTSLWDQFGQFWLLPNRRKAWCFVNLRPFGPARRFSAGLWGACRGTQWWQQCVHPALHLLRGTRTSLVFPRAQFCFNQIAGQHQEIVNNGHDVGPALKLLWGPQPRLIPQQRLLLKAIAMFLTETAHIAHTDLRHIGLLVTNPDKPTDARVTLGLGGMRTHDLYDRHLQPASGFDVHLFPPTDLDGSSFGVLALKGSIRTAMGRGILGLQFGSILAWRSWFARRSRSDVVEAPIALEADQRPLERQSTALTPQPAPSSYPRSMTEILLRGNNRTICCH